jgi:hypothetical protein
MLDSLGLRQPQFPVKRSCDSSHFFFQPSCLRRHSSIRTRGCEISLGASRSGHLIIVLFLTFSGGSGRRRLSHSLNSAIMFGGSVQTLMLCWAIDLWLLLSGS